MKISFYTLGCKANQADNQKIQSAAARLGWQVVPYGQKCDYCVVSACAVTGRAEQRSRQMLRAAKKTAANVIASGCFNKKISGVENYLKNPDEVIDCLKTIYTADPLPSAAGKTRAFVRIQDGCNFNCAYCLIHVIRGQARSRPAEEVINEIKEKEAAGYKEIALTGINILMTENLFHLLERIIKETDIPRIRFGSIDPRLVTDEFLKIFKNPRFLPHLHLSLQSGSERVLKLMNRNYSPEQYLGIIERARKIDPLFSFTTDVIVGFPGETDNDLDQTINLIKKAGFTKVHVFPFSKRPGTAAASMAGKINPLEIKKRAALVIKEAEKNQSKWIKNYLGKEMEILVEKNEKNGRSGYSPYYFMVGNIMAQGSVNQILKVKITPDNIQRPQ